MRARPARARSDLADIRELRHRVQYRMHWRSKAGKLFPIPSAPVTTPDLVAGRMRHIETTDLVLRQATALITAARDRTEKRNSLERKS